MYNYRSRSIALDWGPLRENVARAGRGTWGKSARRYSDSGARERPIGECRDDDIRAGDAGVRHLSRRAGNVARGGSAPRRNLSLTVAGSPAASVTFDGRTYGGSLSVTSLQTLVQHVYDVSVNSKSDLWVKDKIVWLEYSDRYRSHHPGFWIFWWIVNSEILDFLLINSEVYLRKGLKLSVKHFRIWKNTNKVNIARLHWRRSDYS